MFDEVAIFELLTKFSFLFTLLIILDAIGFIWEKPEATSVLKDVVFADSELELRELGHTRGDPLTELDELNVEHGKAHTLLV